MKAAILIAQRKNLVVDDIELPSSLGVGQVLVKLEFSGICGTQLGEIDGVKGEDKYIPHLLGHEGSGVVKDIGPGVKTVKVGDSVVLHWKRGSGIQSEPPKYKWKGKEINAGWVTTFNSYAIVSENRCTTIPDNFPKEEAALFGCAVTTGFGVVENNAKLKMGESVVIFGAGGIGLNIIQAAKLVSAWPIIGVDIHENRLDLAKKLGATHTINSSNKDAFEKIKDILKSKELDVFIDNTGIPKIIQQGYEIVNKEGRVVLVGVPKHGNNINIFSLPLHFGKSISGSFGGECKPDKDIPRYMELCKQGVCNMKSLISQRFKLEEINAAIDSMRKGKTAGRVIIEL
ncbi:zinc-binding dehydrogenase [Prochlorococcus sp. AH-736-F09]|nr:zinc-binding dehydrogenase [Prochlorococcus sp. AH-736-F09]